MVNPKVTTVTSLYDLMIMIAVIMMIIIMIFFHFQYYPHSYDDDHDLLHLQYDPNNSEDHYFQYDPHHSDDDHLNVATVTGLYDLWLCSFHIGVPENIITLGQSHDDEDDEDDDEEDDNDDDDDDDDHFCSDSPQ